VPDEPRLAVESIARHGWSRLLVILGGEQLRQHFGGGSTQVRLGGRHRHPLLSVGQVGIERGADDAGQSVRQRLGRQQRDFGRAPASR
jgi:hypothetical protein